MVAENVFTVLIDFAILEDLASVSFRCGDSPHGPDPGPSSIAKRLSETARRNLLHPETSSNPVAQLCHYDTGKPSSPGLRRLRSGGLSLGHRRMG